MGKSLAKYLSTYHTFSDCARPESAMSDGANYRFCLWTPVACAKGNG